MDNKELLEKIEALAAKREKVVTMLDDMIKMYSDRLKKIMKDEEKHTLYGSKLIAFFRPHNSVEVLDWAEVQKFVKEKNAFDIMAKKLSAAALQKRFDTGEKIPGVSIKKSSTFVIQKIRGEAKNEEDENPEG